MIEFSLVFFLLPLFLSEFQLEKIVEVSLLSSATSSTPNTFYLPCEVSTLSLADNGLSTLPLKLSKPYCFIQAGAEG